MSSYLIITISSIQIEFAMVLGALIDSMTIKILNYYSFESYKKTKLFIFFPEKISIKQIDRWLQYLYYIILNSGKTPGDRTFQVQIFKTGNHSFRCP